MFSCSIHLLGNTLSCLRICHAQLLNFLFSFLFFLFTIFSFSSLIIVVFNRGYFEMAFSDLSKLNFISRTHPINFLKEKGPENKVAKVIPLELHRATRVSCHSTSKQQLQSRFQFFRLSCWRTPRRHGGLTASVKHFRSRG